MNKWRKGNLKWEMGRHWRNENGISMQDSVGTELKSASLNITNIASWQIAISVLLFQSTPLCPQCGRCIFGFAIR